MQTTPVTSVRGQAASRIALGCMTFGGYWTEQNPDPAENLSRAREALTTAVEQGITLFDHADIYKGGESERVFGRVLRELRLDRETLIIQTKCDIRWAGQPHETSPLRFDTSAEHIVESVNGSLQRLGTDYVDILLLHQPDPLMNPDVIARAFDELHASGTVRYFGVSNHNAYQMELLRRRLTQPIVANQIKISLGSCGPVIDGNQNNGKGTMRNEGLLEYCMLHGITPQAWNPVAGGAFTRSDPPDTCAAAAKLIGSFAEEKQCSGEAILVAWLLKHPSGIVPVLGSRTPGRIRNCCEGLRVELSREEWFRLLEASRGKTILQ